jgi:hypothetical protein
VSLAEQNGREVQAAASAFAAEQRIKEICHVVRTAWVRLAGELYTFQADELFKDLGYVTFEEWLASPEIDLSRRWVYELVGIWRDLVVKKRVAPARLEELEPSKLQEVLPAVRRGSVVLEEALADVKALGRQDLRERYGARGAGVVQRGAITGPDPGTGYDAGREPVMVVCPTCGSRVREGDVHG